VGFPPPSIESAAAGRLARRARSAFSAEGTLPSGSLVVGSFLVVAGLLVAAVAGLTASHGHGRLVDLFLLGAGVLLAYATGLRTAPLVGVALVATYIALEAHYGRFDGHHAGAIIAFSVLFGAAALAAGAFADGFEAWNSGEDVLAEHPPVEDDDEPVELFTDEPLEVDSLESLLHEAIEGHGALSLLFVRPDGIERVAEERGQETTRAVLDRLADILRGHLRGTHVLHRAGLFDFWVILPRTSLEAARMTAERVRLAVADGRVEVADDEWVRSSVSVGIASCPIDGRTAGLLRAAAERALTAATQLGGNRTVLHSVPPGAPRGWGLAPEPGEPDPPVGAHRPLE
jgi:diguanylate cyclase (GGDEF)-like protein